MDHGKIIWGLFESDLEVTVVGFVRFSSIEGDKRGNSLFSEEVGDIEAFNSHGECFEFEYFLEFIQCL